MTREQLLEIVTANCVRMSDAELVALNKEFTSDAERKAAFAHMNDGGEDSKAATAASAHAERTGSKLAHSRAEAAHKEAASTHKEKGNMELARAHSNAARSHRRSASMAANAVLVESDTDDNDNDGYDDTEDMEIDDLYGKGAGGPGKKKSTSNIASRLSSSELEVWNTAVEITEQHKRSMVQRLVANASTEDKPILASKLMRRSPGELRELLKLVPATVDNGRLEPIFLGAAGGFVDPFVLTENERNDVLDLEAIRRQDEAKQTA